MVYFLVINVKLYIPLAFALILAMFVSRLLFLSILALYFVLSYMIAFFRLLLFVLATYTILHKIQVCYFKIITCTLSIFLP